MVQKIKIFIILVFVFFIGWCILVIFVYRKTNSEIVKSKKHTKEIYGDIQFKGEVLKVHKIERWGRVSGIMCIKLDYTNVNFFYRFDEISCLKIENGIAVLSTNFIGHGSSKRAYPIWDAIYVEINMDNSGQRIFIDSLDDKYSEDLYYSNYTLIENDLKLCDDCWE